MKCEAKPFGRGSKAPDVRVRTGALNLKADNEYDAIALCMFYRVFFGVMAKPGAKVRLWKLLCSEVEHPEDFAGFIDIPEVRETL